jgi:hypothetical protein
MWTFSWGFCGNYTNFLMIFGLLIMISGIILTHLTYNTKYKIETNIKHNRGIFIILSGLGIFLYYHVLMFFLDL